MSSWNSNSWGQGKQGEKGKGKGNKGGKRDDIENFNILEDGGPRVHINKWSKAYNRYKMISEKDSIQWEDRCKNPCEESDEEDEEINRNYGSCMRFMTRKNGCSERNQCGFVHRSDMALQIAGPRFFVPKHVKEANKERYEDFK